MKNPENVLLSLSYMTQGASEVPNLYKLLEMRKWDIYRCPSLELILEQDRLQGKNDVPFSISWKLELCLKQSATRDEER